MHYMMFVNNIKEIMVYGPATDAELPVIGTIAAQFNDAGVNELFRKIVSVLNTKTGFTFKEIEKNGVEIPEKTVSIIPPNAYGIYLK